MSDADLTAYFEAHRASIEELARSIDLRPSSTILPATAPPDRPAPDALQLLADQESVVLLEQTLGEGGMGIVRLGRQTSLDRSVAVKAVQPKRQSDASTAKLLQEAWVTGYLEHPNIVPVYDLTKDESGQPLMIMKRIEGVPWKALYDDDEAVQERFGAADLLDWNLRVLMQVANALHYAHSRGILHLDLKPSNVMLGPFGEVYLVDWGLAMSLRPEQHRVPAAADNTEIIGTPSFLAPEMLTSEGDRLSERTDVYLLGSMLHTILSGLPPHLGQNVMVVLFKVVNGDRPPLTDAPSELALIVDRAMQLEPCDRFASADEVRLAVQAFLDHRGSSQLEEESQRRLAELERLVADGVSEGVQAVASTARFGFESALRAWPGNVGAVSGRLRTMTLLAVWSAQQGDIATAEDLANELVPTPPELEAALEAAHAAVEAERQRLQGLKKLGQELDLRTGQATRLFIVAIMVIVWTVPSLIGAIQDRPTHWRSLFGVPAASLVILGGLTFWARESMLATRVNRGGIATIVIMILAQLMLCLGAWYHGLGPTPTLALVSVTWFIAAATFAALVERRLWPSVLVYLATWLVCTLWLELRLWALWLANVALLVNLMVVWNPRGSVAPKDVDPS
jgi:eukaryotic-like serine/threonine-protein kinase